MDADSNPIHPTALKDPADCLCELKELAELVDYPNHDLHSFRAVAKLEEEVLRAAIVFNSLSEEVGYEPVLVNQENTMILNSVKKGLFKRVHAHE